MAVKLTITLKIISEAETRNVTDTFVLGNVSKEDVDSRFVEQFAEMCMGDSDRVLGYEINEDEIYTSTDPQFPYDNEFTGTRHNLCGNVLDWKILKSKTKVEAVA